MTAPDILTDLLTGLSILIAAGLIAVAFSGIFACICVRALGLHHRRHVMERDDVCNVAAPRPCEICGDEARPIPAYGRIWLCDRCGREDMRLESVERKARTP